VRYKFTVIISIVTIINYLGKKQKTPKAILYLNPFLLIFVTM